MKKGCFLFCLMFIFLVCSDAPSKLKRKKHFRSKPSDYVEHRFYKQKLDGFFKEADFDWWDKPDDNSIFSEFFRNSTIQVRLWYYKSGTIRRMNQSKQVVAPLELTRYEKEGSPYATVPFGKELEYY